MADKRNSGKTPTIAASIAPARLTIDSISFEPNDPFGQFYASAADCAICGSGRSAAADLVVEMVRATGKFEVSSPSQFWELFKAIRQSRGDKQPFCRGCSLKVNGIDGAKKKAIALLEEAVKLDPKNDAAKRNLAALR